MDVDLDVARSVAIEAAQSAGRLLLERIDSIREVRHKSAVDLVTDVDIASEERVRSVLLPAFPTHSILGEEKGTRVGRDPRYRWIIDPLDGTTNYAHGFPFFCVSVALEVEGQLALGVAYSPTHDELFVAEVGRGATLNGKRIKVSMTAQLALALLATGFPYDRSHFPRALRSFEVLSLNSLGVRRPGSAVLDLCYVACGRVDAFWEHQLNPWDLAAGVLMVREAGGQVSGVDGSHFSLDRGHVLASNSLIHDQMQNHLAGIQ